MDKITINYPFSALVGQEEMQLALLLNAIHPGIGGVLIRGEKGTAKSTAARALASLLTHQTSTELEVTLRGHSGMETMIMPRVGERRPFVELPVGATDDRVAGTLDIEAALQQGQRRFEPGLLAQAHGGVLYVDEVNLLGDHIVDLLLDVAASGVNTVEREGISASHPAQFMLIGTMNPEEGELRPQLLDRFGLTADVRGSADGQVRAEVVRRRIQFEADPAAFAAIYQTEEQALAHKIEAAQAMLADVVVSDEMLELITHICASTGVDGLRADITMYKAASAVAAWESRSAVLVEDVRRAAQFVLPHRRRRQPFEEPGLDQQQLEDLIDQHTASTPNQPSAPPGQNRDGAGAEPSNSDSEGD